MKTTDSFSLTSTVPSLFQIAAFFEDFFPHGGRPQTTKPPERLPFAEFMLNPENLMQVLKPGAAGNEAARAVASVAAQEPAPARQSSRNVTAKKQSEPAPGKTKGSGSGGSPKNANSPKNVEFALQWPSAECVKLAGDFTQWEKDAVEMMNSKEGIWKTVVPLAPGVYSYRFIVDGKWCDDPRSSQLVPNPYGGANAVIQVT